MRTLYLREEYPQYSSAKKDVVSYFLEDGKYKEAWRWPWFCIPTKLITKLSGEPEIARLDDEDFIIEWRPDLDEN